LSDPSCKTIPLSEYPGMNRFVLDWINGDPHATRFLTRGGQGTPPVRTGGPGCPPELVKALIESNKRWGLFVSESVRAWAAGNARSIIAGQQVGFAGGPLYTLVKIASLLKMKREMERDGGKPVTAFFWLATEDHDFDEVAQLSLPVSSIGRDVNRQLNLLTVRARQAVESRTMIGGMAIPEQLITEFLALYDMERPEWLRAGVTFRDSFAELIATIFGGEIVLVDSLLPELRRAGEPLFKSIMAQWNELEQALAGRSHTLESAGYTPQVNPRDRDDYTLLFEIDGDERHVLGGPKDLEPERVSTSALTRPLLQDFVFQPEVFIGGPAEVAYYGQIAPLYTMLDVPMPRVALRAHALVAPSRVLRFMDRYDVKAEEIFGSPEKLLADREPESIAEIHRLTTEGQKLLMEKIEKIADIALPADHSLARAFNKSIGHIEFHFDKLAERAIKALVRKDRERYGAARELVATLYPDGHVQDRIVGWFPSWCEHGSRLIDRLLDDVEPDSPAFRILGL
jgi:bacillithiol synthase